MALVATKSILIGCTVGVKFLMILGPEPHFGHMQSPLPRVSCLCNCKYRNNMLYFYDVYSITCTSALVMGYFGKLVSVLSCTEFASFLQVLRMPGGKYTSIELTNRHTGP